MFNQMLPSSKSPQAHELSSGSRDSRRFSITTSLRSVSTMRKASRSQAIRYHPFFFLLMALVAMTELGLTSFLINAGNESDNWPSQRYHSL